MNLGHVPDLTSVVTLIAGVGGLIVGFVRVMAWLNNWICDDRIKASLDRKQTGLDVARQLEEMGEHFWAAEAHERAWMEVLRRLARFEVNRSHPLRFLAAYIGWLLYFASIGLEMASRLNAWLGVVAVASLFAAMGVGVWFFATKLGFERAVTARAKEKYEHHKREGLIARTGSAPDRDRRAA